MAAVGCAIRRLIEGLRPDAATPEHAPAWRLYRVLDARYVRGLTQRQAAEELAITLRHLARLQEQAIEMLAERVAQAEAVELADGQPHTVQQQIEQEVSSLYEQADDATCDVADAVQGAITLAMNLAMERRVAVHLAPASTPLTVRAPSTAVRQATLSALHFVLRLLLGGTVHVKMRPWHGGAEIVITGWSVSCVVPPEPLLIRELLASVHDEVEYLHIDDEMRVALRLPGDTLQTVLVVDDNGDQLHFYSRCVAGSRYRIEPLRDGRQALPVARSLLPDIIVLDVMLPNSDGWELLAELANDPVTRHIPVVVCSVVNEADLALSLGARLVLAKPVTRGDFLAALQRVSEHEAAARR